ncbi:MAG TPA: PLP-dependent transferase [Candidatus Dormibacteraeota bacterium]
MRLPRRAYNPVGCCEVLREHSRHRREYAVGPPVQSRQGPLIRLSVGVEDVADLIADLESALA